MEIFNAASYFGLSLNTTVPTTGISSSVPATETIGVFVTPGANGIATISATLRLSANDIIRAHTDGAATVS